MTYTKYMAIKDIFDIENTAAKLVEKDPSLLDIIGTLSKEKYSFDKELNLSTVGASKLVRKLWEDKPPGNTKICTFLLRKYSLKCCSKCKEVKDLDLFSKNAGKPDGYNTFCKLCYTEATRDYQREYQRTRKALKLSRVPSWADLDKIKDIYDKCPKGYHVDHIVPLQGTLVSGLHVEYNLQYLPAKENLVKGNKFKV